MHLHEYQAKRFLERFGIPSTEFVVFESFEGLPDLLKEKEWDEVVLKVQIHAGGRGKAGGVRKARGVQEILAAAKEMLGMKIVNQQTGPQGVVVRQLLIAPLQTLQKEYYLGITVDRSRGCITLIASPEGGMEIEEVAEQNPEQILRIPVPSSGQLRSYHLLSLAKHMGWEGALAREGASFAQAIIDAFIAADATLLEINPLALINHHHLSAIDAKITVDDNALFRHPDFVESEDLTQIPEREAEAKEKDLSYVLLEGDIGCMVNGAGLAMATMDIILFYGGKPANFLDVGGGASEEKISEGFKLLLSDPQVKVILVNIFGGIMNCVTLARGMLAACREVGLHIPLVVRLEGTNVEEAQALLKNSGLSIVTADQLDEAAKIAVQQERRSFDADSR